MTFIDEQIISTLSALTEEGREMAAKKLGIVTTKKVSRSEKQKKASEDIYKMIFQ